MAIHHYKHPLPYTHKKLYELVKDIEKYPLFLPGCRAARILSQSETEIVADLLVGYNFFQETFRSRVRLTPEYQIEVDYIEGPFRYLKNKWLFRPASPQETTIEFFIDFQFKNSLFQKLMQGMFEMTFEKMLTAFEKRAHALYGQVD